MTPKEKTKPYLLDAALAQLLGVDPSSGAWASEKTMAKFSDASGFIAMSRLLGPVEIIGTHALDHYIWAHVEWSRDKFPRGLRTKGLSDHIIKELEDIRNEPLDMYEWVDVMILALDGAIRVCDEIGLTPAQSAYVVSMILLDKQNRNFNRPWPDKETVDPDAAIEHVRGGLD